MRCFCSRSRNGAASCAVGLVAVVRHLVSVGLPHCVQCYFAVGCRSKVCYRCAVIVHHFAVCRRCPADKRPTCQCVTVGGKRTVTVVGVLAVACFTGESAGCRCRLVAVVCYGVGVGCPGCRQRDVGGIGCRSKGKACYGRRFAVDQPPCKGISRLCGFANRGSRSVSMLCRFRSESCAFHAFVGDGIHVGCPRRSQLNVFRVVGCADSQVFLGSCCAVYPPPCKGVTCLCGITDRGRFSESVLCRFVRQTYTGHICVSDSIHVGCPGGFQRNLVGVLGCAQSKAFFGGGCAVDQPPCECVTSLCGVVYRGVRTINVLCRFRSESCAVHALILNVVCIGLPVGDKVGACSCYGKLGCRIGFSFIILPSRKSISYTSR